MRGAGCRTDAVSRMRNLLLALFYVAVMTAKLCGPGGVRAVIAENLLLKQQLIVLRRGRQRAPNLTLSDRLLCGFGSLFLSAGRIRSGRTSSRKERTVQRPQLQWRQHVRGFSSHRLANELIDRPTAQRPIGPVRRRQRVGGILSYYDRSVA